MIRIHLRPVKIIPLRIQDPFDTPVIYRHADEGAEELREEDRARRDMHVMAQFLVLQEVLRAVPGVAGDGAVDGGADGVLVPGDRVDHEAVEELVCCSYGLGWVR